MFGPHDSHSVARGVQFVAVRALVLSSPALVLLVAAPMVLMLLPLAFAGLPFLLVSFLSGATSQRFETKRALAWRAVAHPA
jgi:hypothetical protein